MVKPSSASHKGWETEKRLADWLNVMLLNMVGWRVERKVKAGAKDKGDLTGVPGWTMEVKSSLDELFKALKQARVEARHNGTYWYAALLRLRGISDPGDWAWVMTVRQGARLVAENHQLKVQNLSLSARVRELEQRLQERRRP